MTDAIPLTNGEHMELTRRACSSTHWTTRKLAAQLGASHMMVARVWRKHGLKPHRIERYIRHYNKAPRTVKWKYADSPRHIGTQSVGTGHQALQYRAVSTRCRGGLRCSSASAGIHDCTEVRGHPRGEPARGARGAAPGPRGDRRAEPPRAPGTASRGRELPVAPRRCIAGSGEGCGERRGAGGRTGT